MKSALILAWFISVCGAWASTDEVEMIRREFAHEAVDAADKIALREAPAQIVLDGQLSEGAWKQSAPAGETTNTALKILADGEYLYLGLDCALAQPEDKFEIWIAPILQGSSHFQLNITPDSKHEAAWLRSTILKEPDGRVKAQNTARDEIKATDIKSVFDKAQKQFSMEAKLPYAELGIIKGGEFYARVKRRGPCGYFKTDYRKVELENGFCEFRRIAGGDFLMGHNTARLAARNKGPGAAEIGVIVEYGDYENPPKETGQASVTIEGGQEREITVGYDIQRGGYGQVKLAVTAGGKDMGRTFTDICVPETTLFSLLRGQYFKDDRWLEGYLRLERGIGNLQGLLFRVYDEAGKIAGEYAAAPAQIPGPAFIFRLDLKNIKSHGNAAGNYRLELGNYTNVPPCFFTWSPNMFSEKTGTSPKQNTVPIFVDNLAGPIENAALEAGVCFPEGHLFDVKNTRLIRQKDKRELPCQVEELTRWKPGGSIKWAKARFIADIEENSIMREEVLGKKPDQAPFMLEYGEQVKGAAFEKPLKVEEKDGRITVDTGRISAVFGVDGILEGLFADADREGASGAREKICGDLVPYLVDQNSNRYEGRPGAVERKVEQAGPLYACIRAEGAYTDGNKGQLCRFVLRFHFYAGKESVKIEHTWLMDRDSSFYQFADIGLRIGTNGKTFDTLIFDTAEDKYSREKTWTARRDASYLMLQDMYHHHGQVEASAGIYRGARDRWERSRDMDKIGHWLCLRGRERVMAVGLKDAWQQFPTSFEALDDRVIVHLWDSRKWDAEKNSFGRRLLDFRNEALTNYFGPVFLNTPGYQDGTGAKYADQTQNFKGFGKTHELFLFLGADADKALNECRHFQDPVLALPHPQWTCNSGVTTRIAPRNPRKNPEYEKRIDDFIESTLWKADKCGDYGFVDFGSGPHFYYTLLNKPRTREEALLVADSCYRYANHNYGGPEYWWQNYLRSGDRRWHDLARVHANHVIDKCISWETGAYADYATYYFWAGTTFLQWAFMPNNCLYLYVLGGLRRGLDTLEPWSKGIIENTQERNWCRDFAGQNLVNSNGSSMRASYGLFHQICNLYALNWDQRMAARMEELAHHLVALDSPSGLLPGGREAPGECSQTSFMLMPILNYYAATRKEPAEQCIKKLCENYYRNWPLHGYTLPPGLFTLAYDYYFNKRPSSLAIAKSTGAYHEDYLPAINVMMIDPHASVMITHGLPSLMAALDSFGMETRRYPALKVEDADRDILIFINDPYDEEITFEYSYAPNGGYPLMPPDVTPAETGISLEIISPSGKVFKEDGLQLNQTPLEYMGVKTIYGTFAVPKDNEKGTYCLKVAGGPANQSLNFTVRDTSARKMVLDLGCQGVVESPFYFYVPHGVKSLKGGTFGDSVVDQFGASAFAPGEDTDDGIWENRTGTMRAQLPTNLPNVIAFSQSRFFVPDTDFASRLKIPEAVAVPRPPPGGFAGGKFKQGFVLGKNDTLRLHIPPESMQKPFARGTLEFWYKPFDNASFPHINFMKDGKSFHGLWYRGEYRSLLPSGKDGYEGWPIFPYMGCRKFLEKDQWYHVVISHDMDQACLYLFVNGMGRKVDSKDWIKKYWDAASFKTAPDAIEISGSQAGGIIDDIRVSNVVRYTAGFRPGAAPLPVDKSTIALYHLDDSLQAAPGGATAGLENR